MKIDPKAKIEKAASKDVSRLGLCHVYLDVEEKVCVATDGHMLALVPCEVSEGDKSGRVPADALKEARKLKGAEILLNGEARVVGGATRERPQPEQEFPPYRQVIPTIDAAAETTTTLRLNATMLARLAESIGLHNDGEVTLTFDRSDKRSPILVRAGEADGERDPIGVLMPWCKRNER